MRGSVHIQGREYKLLLDPEVFRGAASPKVAAAFWRSRLKPIINRELGKKDEGGARASGRLQETDPPKQRLVLFYDTSERLLTERALNLRARTFVDDDGELTGKTEFTLKFRTPDVLLAARYHRTARGFDPDSVLEEDIAPLQIKSGGKVAMPKQRTTYSRFAISSKENARARLETLRDATRRFPMLREGRAVFGQDRIVAGDSALKSGRTICEWVYQGALVDLGSIEAEFALTLWYVFDEPMRADVWRRAKSGRINPTIAEISFDFPLEEEKMGAGDALRAMQLFNAMQTELPVNPRETSKTALGLPGAD